MFDDIVSPNRLPCSITREVVVCKTEAVCYLAEPGLSLRAYYRYYDVTTGEYCGQKKGNCVTRATHSRCS